LRNNGLEIQGGKFVLHVLLEFLDTAGKNGRGKIMDFGFIAQRAIFL